MSEEVTAAEAAKKYAEAERASKGAEMSTTAGYAEAFKVQIDALKAEAQELRSARDTTASELAQAKAALADLTARHEEARRSIARSAVVSSLTIPGATPLQVKGVLAELGDSIFDESKRDEVLAKARQLLQAEVGERKPEAPAGFRVQQVTRAGVRM